MTYYGIFQDGHLVDPELLFADKDSAEEEAESSYFVSTYGEGPFDVYPLCEEHEAHPALDCEHARKGWIGKTIARFHEIRMTRKMRVFMERQRRLTAMHLETGRRFY